MPDGYADATVLAYKQPVAADSPPPDQAGYVWGAADVKVCVPATTPSDVHVTVSSLPWALVYADGSVAQPSNVSYQQFPLPEYPGTPREVLAGRCVRGWITFPVPASTRPVMVEYAPQGQRPVDWAVTG